MSDYKDKWIAALRSGEYEQGRDVLCDRYGHYCCLGVLAELDGALLPDANEHGERGVRDHTYGPINHCMYLGEGERLATIKVDNSPTPDFLAWRVAEMNDMGLSFEAIADFLETVDF